MITHFLYTDESAKKGPYYNNFYGGLLVPADQNERFAAHLEAAKQRLNLFGEMKWQKISQGYKDKYKCFIDAIFDGLDEFDIRIRIMFTHKYIEPIGLTAEQR